MRQGPFPSFSIIPQVPSLRGPTLRLTPASGRLISGRPDAPARRVRRWPLCRRDGTSEAHGFFDSDDPQSTRPTPPRRDPPAGPGCGPAPASSRVASNFAASSAAEIACRGVAMAVTFTLAARLGKEGYGKVEFSFNVVFWLVLLVRDGLEVIAAREIARHPRLIRPLVDHILALKGLLAMGLLAGLVLVGTFTLRGPTERAILTVYGLMLLTTALGLDYVYRGIERMKLVAVSLVLRTLVYAAGVVLSVGSVDRGSCGSPRGSWRARRAGSRWFGPATSGGSAGRGPRSAEAGS